MRIEKISNISFPVNSIVKILTACDKRHQTNLFTVKNDVIIGTN